MKDTRGFVVRDALVYVFGLPEGNFLPAEEKRTNPEGLVQIVLRPTSKVVLKDGAHVVLFVRARDPADGLLAGVSARRLVRLRLAAPKG